MIIKNKLSSFLFLFIVFSSTPTTAAMNDYVFDHQGSFLVRSYDKINDFGDVCQIALQNIAVLVPIERYGMNTDLALKKEIIQALEKTKTLVCVKDHHVIGFATYHFTQHQLACKYFQRAHIFHLAIRNGYKGQGAGSVLLQAIIDDCMKKENVTAIDLLTVGWKPINRNFIDQNHERNLMNFYRKFDFEIIADGNAVARRYGVFSDRHWRKMLRPEPGIKEIFFDCYWSLKE